MSVMVYPCMLCVFLLMCLFCVLRVCELFGETIRNGLGVVAMLVLNVMEVFSVWVVVLCWIDHVWSSKECVCFACDHNERLTAPSICFCMSEVISSFRRLRAGSQVFALLMVFLCVIWHTMSSGKCLQLLSCPLVCCACLPSV